MIMKRITSSQPASVQLLDPQQVGQRLQIGKTKVYELIRTGELQSVQIGKLRRVPVSVLDAFIEQKMSAA